jgi:hypothetical protein
MDKLEAAGVTTQAKKQPTLRPSSSIPDFLGDLRIDSKVSLDHEHVNCFTWVPVGSPGPSVGFMQASAAGTWLLVGPS